MPISTITNGETGSSVRTKLNSVIGAVNALGTAANNASTDFATADQGTKADSALQGSTGSGDNAILRADGTGGKTSQASGISIDDSDNVAGVESIAAKGSGGLVLKTSGGDTVATFGAGGTTATLPSSTNIGNVSATEIGYLDGVTSAIQTQLDGKASSSAAITIAGNSTALGGSVTQDQITGLSATGIVKRTGANTLEVATAGTDYVAPSGALGTPSSGTLTNCTGLPTSGLTGQVALANGGTGANLTDPNADRLMFWDDSAGAVTWLTAGSGLSITDTTITATGGAAWSIVTGRPQSKALTSNVTSTSTSYADVTGLTISVGATGTYSFEVTGVFTSSVTTEGIKLAMNGPTTSFLYLSVAYGATTTYVNSFATYSAWDDGPTIATTGGSTPREFRIAGVFTATATGTLAVRFAAETGGANSATVNAGTFFRMTPAD